MTFGHVQVRAGMLVVDTAGTDVGRVTNTDEEHFRVDRGAGSIATLSYAVVRAIVGEQVVLDTGPDLDKGA
jgi:hypothetical protein